MINKIDLRKAISSIAISNAKRNTIYRAFSDLDSITKEEFDLVKSDISKVVESMLTKDTVGKANGVASLDSNGSVPIEQLGNIDTTLFLIVRELPTNDIKSNKIYLVPNQNGQGDNVYFEYLYVESVWEKLGEFKPEVDLSHIEAKLETKANITDVDNRLDDLQNYCFKLGDNGSVAAPYKQIANTNLKLNVQTLKNDKEYTYAGINDGIKSDSVHSIYDKTLGKNIEIVTSNNIILDQQGIFFRTSEPLDLTHTFYLDNEKTGIIENLTQLTIEESNVFVNIPYVEIKNLDDDTVPQYIYDTTDNKWIEVAETFYAAVCIKFNTKEPLDFTHEFYVDILGFWTNVKENSTALGYNAVSLGTGSIALGYETKALGDNSLVLGNTSNTNGKYAISIGNAIRGTRDNCIAIGNEAKARFKSSLALGAFSSTGGDYAIALGKNVSNTKSIFGVGFNGVNGIDMDRDNYGLYLKGFGGYDGTNLVVKSGNTETLNPDIKSVQQIINEKADASAIPTKLSQLTNDANFITSYTETDPVWTREKTNYYTKTEIDGKGYLTAHQSLDDYAKQTDLDDLKTSMGNYFDSTLQSYVRIQDISTKADLVDGKLRAEQLPKLLNITTAATAEEVVTKFNALLADLKAKGYMEADTAK